jgi:hypothetical protein
MDAASLSDEELIDEVTTWAARVARGEARHLQLIAELDAREAWAVHGVTSCAHWLSWKLGWARTTARERVRVAAALRALPLTSEAFEAGRLSYSQVRAITRVATPADEETWVSLARHSTGGQLDKAARGAERARAADEDPATRPPKQAARVEWDDDGDLVLTLRLPAHAAVAVLAALELHQTAEQSERDEAVSDLVTDLAGASAEAPVVDLSAVPEAAYLDPLDCFPYIEPPYPLRTDRFGCVLSDAEHDAVAAWQIQRDQARAVRDAWNDRRERLLLEASRRRVAVGRASLADGLVHLVANPDGCSPMTVQLLADPLSGWARTQHDEFLPPATLQQVVEAFPTRWASRGPVPMELRCHDQGRRTRLVTPAQRRLLGHLDGERCRFPSCSRTAKLHAHHVLFWRYGGSTDLDNLVLLCGKHHRLLHDSGYELTLHTDRRLTVRCPEGNLLTHQPELPDASAEALPPANPDTLPPDCLGDRFDLGYVVNVMLAHAA